MPEGHFFYIKIHSYTLKIKRHKLKKLDIFVIIKEVKMCVCTYKISFPLSLQLILYIQTLSILLPKVAKGNWKFPNSTFKTHD
jgi:hypothetical protein